MASRGGFRCDRRWTRRDLKLVAPAKSVVVAEDDPILAEPVILAFCVAPAPRMVNSDAWNPRPCVLRYRASKDQVRLVLGKRRIPDTFRVIFGIPMPRSWSESKRRMMLGQPHMGRPDGDNLVKSLCDSHGTEDSRHWMVVYETRWAAEGFTYIEPTNAISLPAAVSAIFSQTPA